ncbi:MAG: diaminopimelate epimerase [Chloroherpetonaceae bacterium]|nr:diaminopimelate epimerase [Chloroherpetonaceae bacterium]MCS7210313.1 diaminopimelate epimerase [Chloroherpetonaceae bacterium]MDW8019440.1 diaminopimelate epimerase [Chloroherpetonaceae bacterium]MDW8466028.1 diaminopimelate epimerase [Chloroherpetonaceae bacterium]
MPFSPKAAETKYTMYIAMRFAMAKLFSTVSIRTISFTKMSGAGNDFIMIDNRSLHLELSEAQIAKWCKRGTGIGADGLILLEHSSQYDFAMRYYNADGKLGSMCGNGGRCAARFAYLSGIQKMHLTFEANGKCYDAFILDDSRVRLKMQPPQNFRDALSVEGYEGFFVDTGSPHVVIYTSQLEALEVNQIGRKIRHNAALFPEGTNVNFVEPVSDSVLRIRTFERGVENETLACGTGCVAAAVISYRLGKAPHRHITLLVQSGETLEVEFDETLQHVYLTGSASVVFTGCVELPETP